MSERLAELLRAAASEPEPLPMRGIRAGVRRTRRARGALAAGLAAVVAAAVAVPLAVLPGPAHEAELTTTPAPAGAGVVSYGRISVAVPPGWTTGRPWPCANVSEHMVTLGPPPPPISCPVTPQVDTGINVVVYPGSDSSSTTTGTRWAGQPAVTSSVTQARRDATGATVMVTTDFVTLPLLRTQITTQARTAAEATALLHRISVHPATTSGVPATLPLLRVAVAPSEGVARLPDVPTTNATLIAAVLHALRTAPLLPLTTPICNADGFVVTIPGGPVIEVRFGSCDQIVVGNGTLARATPQLEAALAAIAGGAHRG